MGHCISDNTNREDRFRTEKLVSLTTLYILCGSLTYLFLYSMTMKVLRQNFSPNR